MTYRSDSDVNVPYDMFESYNKEDVKNGRINLNEIWTEKEIDSKIAKKEKLTLQFVSNCNTNSKREKYIEELKKYTEITQMGGCVGKNDCGRECEDKLIDSFIAADDFATPKELIEYLRTVAADKKLYKT
uniref:Fucosyltransferase n=1 Tax=Meloidogyne javanica TaxID=6303 RepID=A0A915MQ65_MELJA